MLTKTEQNFNQKDYSLGLDFSHFSQGFNLQRKRSTVVTTCPVVSELWPGALPSPPLQSCGVRRCSWPSRDPPGHWRDPQTASWRKARGLDTNMTYSLKSSLPASSSLCFTDGFFTGWGTMLPDPENKRYFILCCTVGCIIRLYDFMYRDMQGIFVWMYGVCNLKTLKSTMNQIKPQGKGCTQTISSSLFIHKSLFYFI